jgi:phosphatidylserine/phosphatidylglycerophosphate/cardiolipin synthase-like enzyme
MMEINSYHDKIILGRGKGMEIMDTIKKAKRSVKVVSPYLSPDYIKELVKLHHQGKSVCLITCDNIETNRWSDFKVSDLIKVEKIEDKRLKNFKKNAFFSSIVLFIVSIITFSLSNFLDIFFLISAVLVVISLVLFVIGLSTKEDKYRYYPIFKLKVFDSKSGINPHSTNLVHSKIFIVDEEIAYLGSMNFTYSAFKTHYETVIKVMDKNAVLEISKEVDNIFESNVIKEKSFENVMNSI